MASKCTRIQSQEKKSVVVGFINLRNATLKKYTTSSREILNAEMRCSAFEDMFLVLLKGLGVPCLKAWASEP